MITNTANLLTLFRILIIPVLVALFFMPGASATWSAVILFVVAAITDFFDGYFARALNQVSAFGKFLDPIADKLIVTVTLFLLVAFDRLEGLWIIPALVILIREVLIAGLREFLGPYKVTVPVSKSAKWKTTVQLFAIGFLIAGDHGPDLIPYSVEIGHYGLLAAMILTLISGWGYLKVGFKTIQELDQPVDKP
ncbi:MAG: CDP-diacylglycerol--glycerol-3-phosphate 3-phosphatidyltransferase [Pseudomonadota bacterium]